mmetsp:Transcript_107739/g.304588  ORF Transcript_107739/g.304588 Transcript_107739/m.304588 type:complete len:211 (+) Transcript_107739:280-912(+)
MQPAPHFDHAPCLSSTALARTPARPAVPRGAAAACSHGSRTRPEGLCQCVLQLARDHLAHLFGGGVRIREGVLRGRGGLATKLRGELPAIARRVLHALAGLLRRTCCRRRAVDLPVRAQLLRALAVLLLDQQLPLPLQVLGPCPPLLLRGLRGRALRRGRVRCHGTLGAVALEGRLGPLLLEQRRVHRAARGRGGGGRARGDFVERPHAD